MFYLKDYADYRIINYYESIFNYNIKNGGSIDSLRYYNDYVVELKGV